MTPKSVFETLLEMALVAVGTWGKKALASPGALINYLRPEQRTSLQSLTADQLPTPTKGLLELFAHDDKWEHEQYLREVKLEFDKVLQRSKHRKSQ